MKVSSLAVLLAALSSGAAFSQSQDQSGANGQPPASSQPTPRDALLNLFEATYDVQGGNGGYDGWGKYVTPEPDQDDSGPSAPPKDKCFPPPNFQIVVDKNGIRCEGYGTVAKKVWKNVLNVAVAGVTAYNDAANGQDDPVDVRLHSNDGKKVITLIPKDKLGNFKLVKDDGSELLIYPPPGVKEKKGNVLAEASFTTDDLANTLQEFLTMKQQQSQAQEKTEKALPPAAPFQ